MIELRELTKQDGKSPFGDWFNSLHPQAAAKISVYLTRISDGNTSSLKSLGGGIHECRIDYGPGYRIYLGKQGERLIILLGGGTKRRQQKDIAAAKALWADYKKRRKDNQI